MDSNKVSIVKIEYINLEKEESKFLIEIVEILDSFEFKRQLDKEETIFLFDDKYEGDIIQR